MRKSLSVLACLFAAMPLFAQKIDVQSFRYVGPYNVQTPYQIDTVNIGGDKFTSSSVLDTRLPFSALENASERAAIPTSDKDALHLLGFKLDNTLFAKGKISIEGLKNYKLFVDGKENKTKELSLEPGTHDVVVQCLTSSEGCDSLKISVEPEKEGLLSIRQDNGRLYSLDINTTGVGCGGLSVSASGKYIVLGHRMTTQDGSSSTYYDVIRASDKKILYRTSEYVRWIPGQDKYYYTRKDVSARTLYCSDPETSEETILARELPSGSFSFSPSGDFLIYSLTQEGPKEGEVHQVFVPDDRQPGWRDRGYLAKYDLKTGFMQPLTFGYHNAWLCDISEDGKQMLFMTSRQDLTGRPTTLMSIHVMDLQSMETKTLVKDDGFLTDCSFSPDGKQILIQGSPEALKSVGKDVKPDQTPNMYDYQLFVMNISDGKVNPITKKFNPCIQSYDWCKADGKIYVKVENKDRLDLFRIDPKNGKSEFLSNKEEYVTSFDIAENGNTLVYYGQSLTNADKAYALDTKTGKYTLLYDFNAERLKDVELGEGFSYKFKSTRGDEITGFYVLPPNFDSSKKYPLLVYYYGGCSPSSRYCIGATSPQYYAAQGFVFFVVNPSGASGFGQEFAARHVNTAGDGVSDDLIEATKMFCKDYPFINKDKVGCFSASYGGFMTQLLLSKTDIFAAGISHAGISDHTSYWGEGYWGYSYSETSMANSYPWTRKDLYVDRSPIYFADKIHTPLLFLHGSADTNVPIGESIQMFTALKLLNEDTAFVVFDGEDHGVYDFDKRRQWISTIAAWFTKYLKDDDSWWNEMYPKSNL